jgi:hypothetical protein
MHSAEDISREDMLDFTVGTMGWPGRVLIIASPFSDKDLETD